VVSFLKSFIGDLNVLYSKFTYEADPNKVTPVASDATIHEITSTNLNTLKRLNEYSEHITLILQDEKVHSFFNN
jgi:hypothetical protein